MTFVRPVALLYLSAAILGAQGGGGVTGFAASDQISRENRLRTESLVASGVDLGAGAFVFETRLMTVHGLQDVTFDIASNSLLTATSGTLGRGWGHPYEARLVELGVSPFRPVGLAEVYWDANRKNVFQDSGNGEDYESLDASSRYDQLRKNSNGTWRLTLRDGTVYEFDSDGRLTSIANKVRQKLQLSYEDDRLDKVTEPVSGQELRLFYRRDRSEDLLQHIQDAADRIVYFDYDNSNRLTEIREPAALGPVHPSAIPLVVLEIPDNDPAGLSLSISGPDDPGQVGLVMFASLPISHPDPSELVVRLTSPAGTQLNIRTSKSTPGWNLSNVVFDHFDGQQQDGIWNIRIVDSVPGNAGSLASYGMRFTGPAYTTRLTYNPASQIVRVTAPDGGVVLTNTYDPQGRIVSQDDGVATNQPARFAYENRPSGGVITTYTNRTGAEQVYEHDSDLNLVSYTDALGQTDTFEYDQDGNRIRMTDALNRVTRFVYDMAGNLTRVVDPLGNATAYAYDSRNNLTRITGALGHETSYTYTNENNIRRVQDAMSHQDNKTYGGSSEMRGNLLHDGAGMDYRYTSGKVTEATHPASGSSGAEYDDIGRLIKTSDGDGFERRYEYDDRGNVVRQIDEKNSSTRTFYDGRGRKTRTVNPDGGQTFLEYDGNDNLIKLTDASGAVTRYEYDGEDRLIRQIDPLGNVMTLAYDDAGQLVAETDELGNTIRREYDPVGNEIGMYDANGVRIESVVYDDRDLPVEITDALGSKVRMTYDAAERLVRLIDARGKVREFEYDSLDRETASTDPLNRTAQQSYMSDDVTDSLVDARGNEISFGYDPANRMTRVNYPWGSTWIRYNDRDLPIEIDHRGSGRTIDYDYDQAGRMVRMVQSGGGSTRQFNYTYDTLGNLTSVRDGGGSNNPILSYTYDGLSRVTRFIDSAGDLIEYAYDAAGNMTRMTYPDGKRVRYGYDAAGRLVSVVDWAGRETAYTYDKNGLLTGVDLPNGTSREMEYDAVGQLVSRRDLDKGGLPIVEYTYSYDAAGRLRAETGLAQGPGYVPKPVMMTYDNTRDWVATYNGQQVSYDREGNLTSGPLGSGGTMASFQYDAGGNLILAGDSRYSYDAEDNLVSLPGPGGNGRRLLTVNPMPGVSQVIVSRLDTSAQGSNTTRYVWGIGLIYADVDGELLVHHYDYRGSTVALTGDSGQVAGRVSYGPYGEIGSRQGETNTLFLHAGLFGVITSDSGLQYMRYRWYSPNLKRYLTPDAVFGSIDQPGSLNLYSYAGNNPVTRNDPNGQFWNVIGGAIAGAVVGVAIQAVTDLVTGKKPQWEDYAAAAIGGAVGGAIIGACMGVCGPAAIAAMGAVAGAADGAGSVALASAFRGDEPDPNEVVTAGLIGFAFGGVAGGLGAKAGGAGRRAGKTLANVTRPAPKGILKAGPKAIRRAPGRVRFNSKVNQKIIPRIGKQPVPTRQVRVQKYRFSTREASRLNSVDYGRVKSFSLLAKKDPKAANRLAASVSTRGRPPLRARHRVENAGRGAVNRDKKGVFGEHRHAGRWETDLRRAGISLPNSPIQTRNAF